MRRAGLAFGCVFLVMMGCVGPGPQGPTASSAIPAAVQAGDGVSGALGAECEGAGPDLIVGAGALTLERLRMDRQNTEGRSVLRQFACSGRRYRINPGETIELWAEWSGATNPKFRVDWGLDEPGSPDATSCGSCLLRHTYRKPGLFQVTVTLDDRLSTTVTRTFFIEALETPQVPTATVTVACTPVVVPTLTSTGPRAVAPVACHGAIGSSADGEGVLSGAGFDCSSLGGGNCGPISVPVGTTLTVNANGFSIDHRVFAWQGACAGIGTTGTTHESCTFTVTQNTTISVVFRGFGL
ncbi:MAG: PKD domain-containing protein [Vicinamibacteria bacterium]|nr:PKD domain-containing protein [Vicinamibacteria bacterium]